MSAQVKGIIHPLPESAEVHNVSQQHAAEREAVS